MPSPSSSHLSRKPTRLFGLALVGLLAAAFVADAAGRSLPRGDLVVRSVTAPPRVQEPGGRFRVADRVQNSGRGATQAFSIGYLLSIDRTRGRDDVALTGTRRVRALRAGGSSRASVQVSVPNRIKDGSYFLLACADGLGRVPELNERNNCRASAQRVFVAPRPAAPSLQRQPSAVTNSRTASFVFTSGDGRAATFRCRLDDEVFEPCVSPVEYYDVEEGTYRFEVKARDRFGRESPVSKRTWHVDLTAPAAPILAGRPRDLTNVASATFTVSGVEAGARLECTIDSGPVEVCASPRSYGALSEGRHLFAVRARDAANNESEFVSYAWTIDLTPPPAPAITLGPPAISTSKSATFAFAGADTTVTYHCQLDAMSAVPCSTPQAYANLPDGVHSFAVRARDAAGNESTPSRREWQIDTTPPVPTFSVHPADPTNVTNAVFQFSAAEPISSYRCKFDSAVFAPCSSPYTHAGPLAEGSHRLTVEAKDFAGHVGTSTFLWRVDITPPPTPDFVSFPENPTNVTATFSFSTWEPGVTYRCRLDGAPAFSACTSPQSYPGLPDGEHRLEVRSRDAAGNESGTRFYRWMLNTTPPPGLGLDLGVFREGGPTAIQDFKTWLKRPISRALAYIPGDTWDTISTPDGVVGKWQGSGYQVVYSTPMLPSSGATLDAGAVGAYDSYFRSLAQTLARHGQGGAVIRLGWEFNGSWFSWAAKGKTNEFILFWRRIVNAMRAVSPQLQFDWNPAYGPLDFPADQAYPGDAYVDYIGLVVFDQGWEPGYDNQVLRWRNFVNLPFAMQWHQDFAAQHRKPMTFPEWGLTFRDDFPGHGGGDNAYYVEKMYQWLNANNVAYAIYFEHDTPSTRHSMMAGHFPNAAQRFRQLFGNP